MTQPGGVLGHLCPACHHFSHEHMKQDKHLRWCECHRCRWPGCKCVVTPWMWCSTPTVVYPLFVGLGQEAGARIEHVLPPGEECDGYVSCGCDSCLRWWEDAMKEGAA